jgi:hypothetical protein
VALIEIPDEDLQWLRAFTHELQTQDRHCTAAPVFFVVRTWRDYVGPSGFGDREVWVDMHDDPTTFESEEKARETMREEWGLEGDELEERVKGLERFSMHEVARHENVFFTKKGYDEHMELNGHNYRAPSNKDPGFYVQHAFRNPEVKRLLEIVQRLAASQEVTG